MQNDRPIANPNIQTVLLEFEKLCRYYDLVGGCVVADEKESGFTYSIYSTWNAVIEDSTTPLGFRIRAQEANLGRERTEELITGTAWTFGALLDFGTQTRTWMRDLMNSLRKAGIRIHHSPFGGRKLPRLSEWK